MWLVNYRAFSATAEYCVGMIDTTFSGSAKVSSDANNLGNTDDGGVQTMEDQLMDEVAYEGML